ncbi:SH3 domain-containing protein [Thermocoleostomius sinensis]|uniref:SH3 domain-containing protein n=1 Tax=Thermocoleostomius sinensis A174 TaxID=2016057 RepID=A0A9E9CBK7_9CYAN|nr:SH3 domain-containing protein [Thermocoleostomius sinensis]WAL62537.1 SH3 domain-containing protein [Thermocoleostomius sinensis A174]
MTWSGFSKLILGVLLAIGILFGTGVSLTRYLIGRLATPPPRPVFANDPSPVVSPVTTATEAPPPEEPPLPEEAAPVSPSPVAEEGYTARVIQPIGLILRDQPSRDAVQVGGIEFNRELTVLETSSDGEWQRVRLGNGAEGWVRAGNTERLN